MALPFVTEIRIVPYDYMPRDTVFCDGQALPKSQYLDAFNLLGKLYGGDGVTTFGVPDLRGRLAVHMGEGPGLTPRVQAEVFGAETVALTANQIPPHTHSFNASKDTAAVTTTDGKVLAKPANRMIFVPTTAGTITPLASASIQAAGSQAHENQMPFMGMRFCMAVHGIFPGPTAATEAPEDV